MTLTAGTSKKGPLMFGNTHLQKLEQTQSRRRGQTVMSSSGGPPTTLALISSGSVPIIFLPRAPFRILIWPLNKLGVQFVGVQEPYYIGSNLSLLVFGNSHVGPRMGFSLIDTAVGNPRPTQVSPSIIMRKFVMTFLSGTIICHPKEKTLLYSATVLFSLVF